MRTRPPVVIYTRTCAAKSPGENATYADVMDAGKFRTAARSARDHPSSTANPDFSRFRPPDLNKIKHLQLMS
jgi:hypothetical protein